MGGDGEEGEVRMLLEGSRAASLFFVSSFFCITSSYTHGVRDLHLHCEGLGKSFGATANGLCTYIAFSLIVDMDCVVPGSNGVLQFASLTCILRPGIKDNKINTLLHYIKTTIELLYLFITSQNDHIHP
jgi:hypothetical protein